MSYAARLAAMSRGHVPAMPPRALAGDAEAPREETVETEVRAPQTVAAALAVARMPVRSEPAQPVAPVRASRVPAEAVEPGERREIAAAPVMHETIERRTIIEAAPPAEHRLAAPTPAAPAPAPVRLPPQAQWLAEDAAATDPLVASSEGDALRELMRSVRQWTSSAPTVVEQHHHAAAPDAAAVPQPVVPRPETHVSIGNVTITVDDAPVATSRSAAAPPRTASNRLARNHIRGG